MSGKNKFNFTGGDFVEVVVDGIAFGDDGSVGAYADGKMNDAFNGDVNELVAAISNPEEFKGGFHFAEGIVVGAVDAYYDEEGRLVVKESVNQKNLSVLNKLVGSQRVLTSIVTNDLRKRLGEVRRGGQGAWVRVAGGEMSGDYGLESDFQMVQAGFDSSVENSNLRFGAAFSYGKADTDDVYGSSDFDAFSFAGYGVWNNEEGQFDHF